MLQAALWNCMFSWNGQSPHGWSKKEGLRPVVAHSGTLRVKSLTVSVSVSIISRISAATYLLGVLAKFSSVISPSLSDCSMSVFFSSMVPSVPYSAVWFGAAGRPWFAGFPWCPYAIIFYLTATPIRFCNVLVIWIFSGFCGC